MITKYIADKIYCNFLRMPFTFKISKFQNHDIDPYRPFRLYRDQEVTVRINLHAVGHD